MPGRLPTAQDFDSSLTLSITPPPLSQQAVNVLILLHGFGDTNASFKKLGEQLSLPETACISLQGPTPLPFDTGGFQWGDDLIFDQGTGSLDMDTGFKTSTASILKLVQSLQDKCGYSLKDVIFFGFGQGGMAALNAAVGVPSGEECLGVVSVGGPLPAETPRLVAKNRTPVLILGGFSESLVGDSAVDRLKSTFEFVESKKWRRPGDAMPRNRDEMMPIMQFFARRLKSRQGIPEGSVEL